MNVAPTLSSQSHPHQVTLHFPHIIKDDDDNNKKKVKNLLHHPSSVRGDGNGSRRCGAQKRNRPIINNAKSAAVGGKEICRAGVRLRRKGSERKKKGN